MVETQTSYISTSVGFGTKRKKDNLKGLCIRMSKDKNLGGV